jgi:hypothetical protein
VIVLNPSQLAIVRDAVVRASKIADLADRIAAIYAEVQAAIDARRPRCDVSGRCCQFEKFGHLLFVTTLELAAFAQQRPPNDSPDGDGCRYQINGLCTAHTVRPFGCRIFFCDPTAEDWQQEQYELFHTRLKQLHDELSIPYLYVEWRQGLAAIDAI